MKYGLIVMCATVILYILKLVVYVSVCCALCKGIEYSGHAF